MPGPHMHTYIAHQYFQIVSLKISYSCHSNTALALKLKLQHLQVSLVVLCVI